MKFVTFTLICIVCVVRTYGADSAQTTRLDQENATWSRSIYFRGFDPTTREKLTDETLAQFGSGLERNGIRYAYIFSGPYQKDGHLPPYAFSARARESVAFLKKAHPKIKILPWIGGVEGKTVFLEDAAWVRNSIQDTARLIESIPFDGVHVDIEYVLFPKKNASTAPLGEYDAGWIRFHRKLRETLPRAFISTVVVSSAPDTKPWKHKHSTKDLTEASRVVDQVVFMYYETGLHDPKTYRENMRMQLRQIDGMKDELGKKSPQYLFGIGTFKSEKQLTNYRDMRLENVSTTLSTLREIVEKDFPYKRLIDGLAIYCEWLTGPEDWNQIRTQWTGRVH